MANRIKKTEKEYLLSFSEIQVAVKRSAGKKSKKTETKVEKAEYAIVRGNWFWYHFSGMNPSETIAWGRRAQGDTEAMIEAIEKMIDFKEALEHGYKSVIDGHQLTPLADGDSTRGSMMSLFSAFGIRISTDTNNSEEKISDKDEKNQDNGLCLINKETMFKLLESANTPEMRCFIYLGCALGWRIGDLCSLKVKVLKNNIKNNPNGFTYSDMDEKEDNRLCGIFRKLEIHFVKEFLETINDDRVYLFGDARSNIQYMRNKFQTIVNKVFPREEYGYNVMTPHFMRKFTLTIVEQHGYNEGQAKRYVGKTDKRYSKLTLQERINIYNAIKNDINITRYDLGEENLEDKIAKKVIDSMKEIMSNEGLKASYQELITKVGEGEVNEMDLTAEKRAGIALVGMFNQMENSILSKVEKILKAQQSQ